uniref:CX domain-containing protein n=1 Tax=Steinernema glaseri TaxID=37863 RepID=A0A1I7Z7J0_9BILA
MCRMPIDSTDKQLGNIYFENNTRPREIVWSCDRFTSCCGMECCPSGGFSAGHIFLIIMGVLLSCLGICACYKCAKVSMGRSQSKYTAGTEEQPPPYHEVAGSNPYAT